MNLWIVDKNLWGNNDDDNDNDNNNSNINCYPFLSVRGLKKIR